MNTNNELKPIEICLGNFIESMGSIEMVTGIIREEDDNFRIGHTGWANGKGFMPDDVLYNTYPIPLTDHWKVCFAIEKQELPSWVKYVHQTQNYFKWALNINLLEQMDWDLLPKKVDIDL